MPQEAPDHFDSTIFYPYEFYIVNSGPENPKPALEKTILANGGRVVQNLLQTTTHLLAFEPDFRTRNVIGRFKMNVIYEAWMLECVRRQRLLELEPRYMLYATPELEEYFRTNIGRFGDHHTQAVDVETLRGILLQTLDEDI